MTETPREHRRLIADIDRLLAEAKDDASRQDLERLRARLSSPEMVELARDLESRRPRGGETLTLEFHDPLLPAYVTLGGGVVSAAVCLFAILTGLENPDALIAGARVNLWLMAALAGAATAFFTAMSLLRTFSVRIDTEGMVTRVTGQRWRNLRVGAMNWKNIRSLHERRDRVLEVRAASGEVFEIPTRVVNFPILRHHLETMVMFYGEMNPAQR